MPKTKIAIILAVLLVGLALLLPPIDQRLTNGGIDLLQKTYKRPASVQAAFIYFDTQDLQALKGWPITRDYYGYLIFLLKQTGARTVVLDVLLADEYSLYPEYDAALADMLASAHNVLLPFAFAEFTAGRAGAALGAQPQPPAALFQANSSANGFSNLADETVVRTAPVVAMFGDSLVPSLGLAAAAHFLGAAETVNLKKYHIDIGELPNRRRIPTDRRGAMRLNFFDLTTLPAISAVEAMQRLEENQKTLDLHDKLVFIGVTAPGTAPLKTTPIHAALPATLIHLTVAENIIAGAFLRTLPTQLNLLLIMIAAAAAFGLQILTSRLRPVVTMSLLSVYVMAAVFLFRQIHVALPMQPPLTFVLGIVALQWFASRQKLTLESNLRALYQQEVERNRRSLIATEEKLHELTRTLSQQSETSAEAHQAIAEKEAEIRRLNSHLRDLQQSMSAQTSPPSARFPQIIHAPAGKMAAVLELAAKIGPSDIPVLLIGETGTGKEEIACALHQSSKRSGAFVAVNCGALPETLLESELFGHEKGAFTGAVTARKGRFELADGGTIFLDEITETSAAFQAKLLRVLQEGAFERLGGEKTQKVNVRVVSASGKNIPRQVQEGRFREDLFYRLNGFLIELPPLRERREDIPLLADHFLKKHQFREITGISERAMEHLRNHNWPGNVRELENCIRHAAVLARSDGRKLIQEQDLPKTLRAQSTPVYEPLDVQILHCLRSLQFSHSSVGQTAKALGDKDRGTVTEYLRGMIFESLVRNGFSIRAAAHELAEGESQACTNLERKIVEYVEKLNGGQTEASGKGLPKKYHDALRHVLEYLQKNGALKP